MAPIAFIAILIAAALLGLYLVEAAANTRSPAQRIADGCNRRFGGQGQKAVESCEVKLMYQHISDLKAGRADE